VIRLIAALPILLAATGIASACKCASSSREEGIAANPVVFEGRVLRVKTNGTSQATTMKVVRAIKGVANGGTVTVRSGTQSASCGYDFRTVSGTITVGGERAEGGAISVRRCAMVNLNN
jgi:hypothetical protein